jgi:ribose/xylose/arabinose/galactoside ABC-type transport system permease subunit
MADTVKKLLKSESSASLIALIAVIVVFTAINDRFLSRLNIEGIIVSASISAIVSLGMTLVIAMRALDLSVGSIMGFTAIISAKLLAQGLPLPLVVAIGLVASCALGLVNGLLITFFRLPSFVATLATLSVILGVSLLVTNGATVTIHDSTLSQIVIGRFLGLVPSAALIAATAFFVVTVIFWRTRFGRHVAAIGGETRAAIGAGVNVTAVTIGVFMISGSLAAVAGMMSAGMLQNADSTIGAGAELIAIAVVVVGGTSLMGGRGNLIGTMLAALLLASIKSGLNIVNVPSLYEGLIFGGILIVALMIDGMRRTGRRKGMLVV